MVTQLSLEKIICCFFMSIFTIQSIFNSLSWLINEIQIFFFFFFFFAKTNLIFHFRTPEQQIFIEQDYEYKFQGG